MLKPLDVKPDTDIDSHTVQYFIKLTVSCIVSINAVYEDVTSTS